MKKQQTTPAQFRNLAGVPAWFRNALLGAGCLFLVSCGGDSAKQEQASSEEPTVELADDPGAPAEDNGLGVGPVKSVDVSKFDAALAAKGKSVFEGKCSACHQLSDQKIVGPGLAGVTERRKPEWIMNMIINPVEMTQKDPQAKKLLAEHLTQMTNQDISEPDARALLEFMRQNDGAK
ncbi:cytochrome c [Adhaeribacter sp. BT258]|uniref:Cytochrome c n=1 Tax=Adhaeribacter terrigena TaxID=2793070 RepID=A0ABS1C1I8_9BACT|nr:cytochrome c [Adhaeribacter terrigena]MBK0402410.1 cytochrome c [Adhaeribacter terrigena]